PAASARPAPRGAPVNGPGGPPPGDGMDRIWIRNLLDSAEEVIYFKDLQSRFLRVSLGMAQRHGLTQEQMYLLTDFDLFAEAHAAAALADEQEIIRTGKPIIDLEECESFVDRPTRWVSTSKFPLRDLDGRIIGTFGISRDITRRVVAEQAMERLAERSAAASAELARVEAQLRAVLNGSSDAIAQYSPDLRYRYVNPAGERLRGLRLDALIGRTDRELVPDLPGLDTWEAALREVLETGTPREHEFSMALPDGKEGWFHTTLSPETDVSGAVGGVLTSTRDVTQAKLAERALAHQAMHDPVTGLANRYLLMDRLGQAMLRLERSPGKVALVFIDVDHFKAINDSYGHEVGDEVLMELARRLSAVGRREDTVARLGGDEFVMLCENVQGDADVRALAGRGRQRTAAAAVGQRGRFGDRRSERAPGGPAARRRYRDVPGQAARAQRLPRLRRGRRRRERRPPAAGGRTPARGRPRPVHARLPAAAVAVGPAPARLRGAAALAPPGPRRAAAGRIPADRRARRADGADRGVGARRRVRTPGRLVGPCRRRRPRPRTAEHGGERLRQPAALGRPGRPGAQRAPGARRGALLAAAGD